MQNTDFDRFAKMLNFEIEKVDSNCAVAHAKVKDEYLNGVDIAHGGFLFSLADYTTAVAANSQGRTAISSSASIEYMMPCPNGEAVKASAKLVSGNTKTGLYQCLISSADGNSIYCVFSSRMVFKRA